MSQSSGVFTFPSTGYWLVGHGSYFHGGNSSNDYIASVILSSTNSGTNWYDTSFSYTSFHQANLYGSTFCQKIFDVTNTSTVLCAFRSYSQDNNHIAHGETNDNATYSNFIRLGDT